MLKKITFILFICIGCTFEKPTEFSEKAQNATFYTIDNSKIVFKDILEKYKGQKILIEVWASWCKDCIIGFPKLKELQQQNPEIVYVFLSADKNISAWKRGVNKYNLLGEHYFMEAGLKSDFGDFLNSNWIPRFLVVNKKGSIDLFKAIKVTDVKIVEALKK